MPVGLGLQSTRAGKMARGLGGERRGRLLAAQGVGARFGRRFGRDTRAQGLADPWGVSLAPGAHPTRGTVGVHPARGC